MKKFLYIYLILFYGPAALYGGAGTTAADFLNISLGARPVAMGDSFTAVPGDIYSIYYNPAGLYNLSRMEGSFMHSSWLGQAKYENFLFAYPEQKWTAGIMVNYLGIDAIDGLDKYGFVTGDEHKPKDMLFAGSFAMSPANKLAAGINLKYISSSLTDDISGSAVAVDIGGQYELMDGNLVTGLALKNLGTEIELGSGYKLPFKAAIGGAYQVREDALAVMDISMTKAKFVVSVGGEYSRLLGPVLSSLRLGYSLKDSDMEGIAGLRCGLGVRWNDYLIDYAWRPGGELGTSHLVSLTARFGPSMQRSRNNNLKAVYIKDPEGRGLLRVVNSFVAGNIKDEENNPLSNVTIRIDKDGEEGARIFTDSKGNYQSDPMIPGIYEMKVWEKGYFHQTVEIEIKESSPVKMDFTLKEGLK